MRHEGVDTSIAINIQVDQIPSHSLRLEIISKFVGIQQRPQSITAALK